MYNVYSYVYSYKFLSIFFAMYFYLIIFSQINQTLLEVHDIMMPDDWLNETETVLLLRTICDYSFQQ